MRPSLAWPIAEPVLACTSPCARGHVQEVQHKRGRGAHDDRRWESEEMSGLDTTQLSLCAATLCSAACTHVCAHVSLPIRLSTVDRHSIGCRVLLISYLLLLLSCQLTCFADQNPISKLHVKTAFPNFIPKLYVIIVNPKSSFKIAFQICISI